MNMPLLRLSVALATCLAIPNSFAQNPLHPATLQVFIGALELDDQSGQWSDLADGTIEAAFDTLPNLGLEAEFPMHQGWLHWGVNTGGSLAYKESGIQFYGTRSASGNRVELDNSLLLAEVHLGGYLRGRLHPQVTTYAAAGPMLLYSVHEVEEQRVRDADGNLLADETALAGNPDASSFDIGYYARAGVDFEFRQGHHLGVGLRYTSGTMDFDDTIGNLDLDGSQFVFSFSKEL